MRPANQSGDIAIIGMSATFAGAGDLRSYWENILGKVDAVREAPDSWAAPYFDPEAAGNDRIYTRRGGFLGALAEFDPKEFGIMPNSVDGGEPDQYLALKMARDALRDAGYMDRAFDRVKTGVILGRGTYVNRGYTTLMQHGLVVDQTLELLHQLMPQLDSNALDELRKELKASLPPFTAESCPGMVPNIVSGRIANRLDLMGPNFIIDAACASSLIAVGLAVEELRSGRCDMMLSGGIHASTPPQIYMIFCQLGGLSRDLIRPFDVQAKGTLLGEGAGVLVLKRLADAERDGDRIYALIKGVASASDGKALGLLAPRLEGEVTALRRAYEQCDVDPATVGLVEAHGTGIPLGDQTEVQALSTVFGQRKGHLPGVGLGSVKSMIGHCIPAAGAAGMIKTALALHHKILPPMLAGEVNPSLGLGSTPFYVNNEARPWVHADVLHPRRAGVNAFGFGGINAHAVLEEYRGSTAAGQILHGQWPSELVACSASTAQQLVSELEGLVAAAKEEPSAPLWDLARRYCASGDGAHRAAIVCRSREDLKEKATFLCEKLRSGAAKVQARSGIYYAQAVGRPKTALLFPGEGAQYTDMLADLCLYFPAVRRWFDFLDETFAGVRDYKPSSVIFPPPTSLTQADRDWIAARLYGMDLGSEACFVSGMALHELLSQFGLKADVMVGHSTGETIALVASGTVRFRDRAHLGEKIREWNSVYRQIEGDGDIPRGVLLTVGGVPREALDLALAEADGRLHLAMDNCPNQAVLFGSASHVARARDSLAAAGGICAPLPFDRGYHTPLFERATSSFRGLYDSLDVSPGHTPVASCATCELFPSDPGQIRALAARQWAARVRFRETVDFLYRSGVRSFVEVGPSSNLTSFVEDTLRGRDVLAVASNSRRRPGLEQFQTCLARLFVQGCDLDFAMLYRDREPLAASEPGPSTVAVARKPVLTLELPRLQLAASLVERIRENAAPLPIPTTGSSDSRSPGVPLRTEPVGRAGGSWPRVPDAQDFRSSLVKDHFALMQDFLNSQRNLLGLVGEPGSSLPGKTPAAPAAGALRWPLLGRIEVEQPDLLVFEREISLGHDPYLHDHTLGGAPSSRTRQLTALPVVPFTFSMEMLAEAALHLAGNGKVIQGMEAVRGYRWLTLDREVLSLRVEVRRVVGQSSVARETYTVRVYQPSEKGPLQHVLVFEGRVHVGSSHAVPVESTLQLGALTPSRQRDDELYARGMFHGPLLRGVQHLRGWSAKGIEADLITRPTDGFFAAKGSARFATDAGLLDAAGQLVGYWLSEQFGSDFNCFPFEVSTYEQYAAPADPGELVHCRAQVCFTEGHQIEASFDLLDSTGRMIARLVGWRDRYFSMPERYYNCRLEPQTCFLSESASEPGQQVIVRRLTAFPDELLEQSWGIWGRVLAYLVLGGAERATFSLLPVDGKRRSDWLLARICAKDAVREWLRQTHGLELAPADVELGVTEAGKPVVLRVPGIIGPFPDISLAHSDGLAMAALVPPGLTVGVDVQCPRGLRTADVWAGGFAPDEQAWLDARGVNDRNEAGLLSCWCAKEAAAKASGLGLQGNPKRWCVVAYDAQQGRIDVKHAGRDFNVRVRSAPGETFALCVSRLGGGEVRAASDRGLEDLATIIASI